MLSLNTDLPAVPGQLVDLNLGACTVADVLVRGVWSKGTRHTEPFEGPADHVDVILDFYDVPLVLTALAHERLQVENPHAGADATRVVEPPRCEQKP